MKIYKNGHSDFVVDDGNFGRFLSESDLRIHKKLPILNSNQRELKQMEPILNFQVPRTGDFTTYTVLSFEAS